MNIVVPPNFRHSGHIPTRYANSDPRRRPAGEERATIDLRGCEFIRPAAVLWTVVYSSLTTANGGKARVLVPDNDGVCVYLKSLNVFDTMKDAGVEVDDRDIFSKTDIRTPLRITTFHTATEADELAEQALDRINAADLGAANIRPVVASVFSELATNAVQHAQSPIGGYGFIQLYNFSSGLSFVVAVADGGIGIRAALSKNPELADDVPYDWTAVERATRERVTGTGERTRGIGLYYVSEEMRRGGRSLIIHSGRGFLRISEQAETRAIRETLFPGTLTYASIPT